MENHISERILKILDESKEPLETKEIEEKLKNVTRIKIMYRLNNLRGEGKIRGKSVGGGKGNWVWWSAKHFK